MGILGDDAIFSMVANRVINRQGRQTKAIIPRCLRQYLYLITKPSCWRKQSNLLLGLFLKFHRHQIQIPEDL